MSDPAPAIFLSYASEDAEAARRICDAMRATGLEVWLDQSELRGGDAWDASIRRQIRECALFVPLISQNTDARSEGYFRLEWKLAVDRSHLLADDHAFLLPVAIDETPQATARVPDPRNAPSAWFPAAPRPCNAQARRARWPHRHRPPIAVPAARPMGSAACRSASFPSPT